MKYYVIFGDFQRVLHCGNPYQACIKTLQQYLDNNPESIHTTFRVSQRGFNEHEDDLIIDLDTITKILYIIANPDKEINSLEEEDGTSL